MCVLAYARLLVARSDFPGALPDKVQREFVPTFEHCHGTQGRPLAEFGLIAFFYETNIWLYFVIKSLRLPQSDSRRFMAMRLRAKSFTQLSNVFRGDVVVMAYR